MGALNNVVMLAIALTKALLVILFFMHVRWSTRLTWLVVALRVLLAPDHVRHHDDGLPHPRMDCRVAQIESDLPDHCELTAES